MINDALKKIKRQRRVGMLFIIFPATKLISYFGKGDYEKYGNNSYYLGGSLLLLIMFGIYAVVNSYKKQKEINQ